MLGLALASPSWRELDWWLFARQTRAVASPLQRDLILLDVPHVEEVAAYRDRLLFVLDQLLAGDAAPRAIVFDVQFVAQEDRLAELMAALTRLRQRGTRLFAVVDPMDGPRPDPLYMKHHARRLYEEALDGHGHTLFEHASGLVKYEPFFDLRDGQRVPALAVQVAESLFGRPRDADTRPIVVRTGDVAAVRARTLRVDFAARRLAVPPGLDPNDRIVVLGSLERDRPVPGGISGPEYLLWALSARGQPPELSEARVTTGPALLAALVLATGTVAAGLARWIYARFPRSHTRVAIIPAIAATVPIIALYAGSRALAAAGMLLPQVSLPALGALVAAALAWVYVRAHLKWARLQAEPEPLAAEYDVFISYSRSDPHHAEWVRSQVVEPLRRAQRPDGKRFAVFFDTQALQPGDAWIERLYHAIDASRFFVPVYSADYFKKDFCRREIAHALRRQGTDKVFIVPLDHAGVAIPSPYDDIQTLRLADHPGDFVQKLIETMQRVLRAEFAASPITDE
jgi:hypothetical protein